MLSGVRVNGSHFHSFQLRGLGTSTHNSLRTPTDELITGVMSTVTLVLPVFHGFFNLTRTLTSEDKTKDLNTN